MRPLASEINDIRPLSSISAINKLIAILERRKTALTPALDFTICCMINNSMLEQYYHEQLIEKLEDSKSKIKVNRETLISIQEAIEKNRMNGLLAPNNPNDPINKAIKMSKVESTDRIIGNQEYEHGLSDW